MARTGLRVGDGHHSLSPCTGLPESAWLAETRTASCLAKCERTHLCPEVPGNSGRTKAGIGTTSVTQRGPPPLCLTNPKSGLLFDGSTSTPPTWASVSTESWLRGSRLPEHEPLSRRGTCPESKGGDDVHACLGCTTVNPPGDLYGILPPCCPSWQSHDSPWERGESESMPGRELSAPGSLCTTRQTLLSRLHTLVCPRRLRPSLSGMRPSWPFGDGESHPFWLHSGEKGGFAISKGCESNCMTPWLSEWLVLWSGTLKASSTKRMGSCGVTPEAAQGRLRPWGLRACDKCSLKHYGLVWSGPNMSWGWKSGQGPDGPASEWIPSELPKPQFAERGREHSSWYLFWGQEHKRGGGRHLFDGSLTPWSGPEWANH